MERHPFPLFFGFFHSLLAQKFMQEKFQKLFPPQTTRAFFLCWTGMTILAVMMCWQDFHANAWKVEIINPMMTLVISFAAYTYFVCHFLGVIMMFGMFDFFGYAQLSQSAKEVDRGEIGFALITDGIYGWVRHPMYTFLLSAFIVTPVMSLDRLYLIAMTVLYLYFAVPVEEKKLIAKYGQAYEKYRKRVPAVVPWISRIMDAKEKFMKVSKEN